MIRQIILYAACLCWYSGISSPRPAETSPVKVVNLKCNNLTSPLGIDAAEPLLSWQLVSDARNQRQSAWQVLAAGNPDDLEAGKGTFWNSGKVKSGETTCIRYQGKSSGSGKPVYWKARIWDGAGHVSGWSDIAHWETGYLLKSDWKARWIGAGEDQFPDSAITGPAPYFRKSFILPEGVVKARVSVCGLGFYELYLNGQKTGDQVLAPAQTNYDLRSLKKLLYFHDDQSRQRVLYNTFDVTGQLVRGENVVGVILGNGWYNQRDRTVEGRLWYDTPRLILQIDLTDRVGRITTICSDNSWKVTTGPVLHDGIFTGELYDARLEKKGWNLAGFDDGQWKDAALVRAPAGELHHQEAPFDKVIRTIRPSFTGKTASGVLKYDAGEMISGWVKLKMNGASGDTVRIRYFEELGRDYGQEDIIILKGGGEESWEPRFTWHAFRTFEIFGLKNQPAADKVEVKVVHTEVTAAGQFSCSNNLFNRIHDNYVRTQLGNLHGSISSDCPHRERLGYTGDGQVAMEAALYCFDMAAFYRKWLRDMEDARNHVTGYVPHTAPFGGGGGGPAWGSALVLMPWNYFSYYGDKEILREHYDGMLQWVSYLGSRCDGDGIVVREEPKGWCLGDWATPEKIRLSPELVNTCYYYRVTSLVAGMAALLGKKEDAQRQNTLATKIAADFHRKFFNRETGEYLDGKQGANLFPMAFGMTPEAERKRVFSAILKQLEQTGNHFDTGILGTPLLLQVLSENGRSDLACAVLNQEDFPGYGYYILGKNATTLWENWNGGGSHSHPMYGSVVAWLYQVIAGIRPGQGEKGWREFVIDPWTGSNLTHASATWQSVFGTISSRWKKENDRLLLEVEIPVNSMAVIYLPGRDRSAIEETAGKGNPPDGLTFIRQEADQCLYRAGSGKYRFVVKNR